MGVVWGICSKCVSLKGLHCYYFGVDIESQVRMNSVEPSINSGLVKTLADLKRGGGVCAVSMRVHRETIQTINPIFYAICRNSIK
jgi:hypothetical protein